MPKEKTIKIVPSFDATRQVKKIRKEIDTSLKRVLDSGKFVMGKEVENFESTFSSFIGSAYGVGVNSGTDAIKIALKSLNIGAGDEVITVANTATPTVSAIRETGAMPVLVDCDEYFLIDVKKIEPAITSKTKAIIPVHLYGQPTDMTAIMKIAKKHNLKVIEDCAQSAGAGINGKLTGSFGHIACFSFFPTKNLGTCGDGGMITTNDLKLSETCRRLRRYGMDNTYFANIEGYNSRLQEFQASILSVKLPHLPSYNKRRQEIATRYINEIKNPLIKLPKIRAGVSHIFHLLVIEVEARESFIEHLKKNCIGYGIHYPFPIHLQKAYSFLGKKRGSFPLSEAVADRIISLPIFPELTEAEVSYVIRTVNAFKPY